MEEGDYDRAHAYHMGAPALVPGYSFLQSEAVRMLPFARESRITVVELGSGSGRVLRRVLDRFPYAHGFWCDRSADAEGLARDFLRDADGRVTYLLMDLNGGWHASLPDQVDAIVSMSAVHHLDHTAKERLYLACHEHLKSKSPLVLVDEFRAEDPLEHVANIKYWVEYAKESASSSPEVATYHASLTRRPLSADAPRPGPGSVSPRGWTGGVLAWLSDRRLDTIRNTVTRLKQSGFDSVRIPIQYYLWACVVAEKG